MSRHVRKGQTIATSDKMSCLFSKQTELFAKQAAGMNVPGRNFFLGRGSETASPGRKALFGVDGSE